MKRILSVALISLILIAFGHTPSFAFRCNGKIITVGDTKFDVISKCGEPAYKDFWLENRISRDFFRDLSPEEERGLGFDYESDRELYRDPLFVEEYVTIEEWTYNFGPNRFVRYLRFENNKLLRITTGRYGY